MRFFFSFLEILARSREGREERGINLDCCMLAVGGRVVRCWVVNLYLGDDLNEGLFVNELLWKLSIFVRYYEYIIINIEWKSICMCCSSLS